MSGKVKWRVIVHAQISMIVDALPDWPQEDIEMVAQEGVSLMAPSHSDVQVEEVWTSVELSERLDIDKS